MPSIIKVHMSTSTASLLLLLTPLHITRHFQVAHDFNAESNVSNGSGGDVICLVQLRATTGWL